MISSREDGIVVRIYLGSEVEKKMVLRGYLQRSLSNC